MDFKLPKHILDFIKFQKTILRKYRCFIKEKMQNDYKKAAIFVYWLNDYITYIKNEDKFKAGHLINYKRGQIILVNFGYRIGKELGGNHYAIVLDVRNSRYTDTLTVVPLMSKKPKETYYSKVYHVSLGECVTALLYDKAYKIMKDQDEATDDIVNAVVKAGVGKVNETELREKLDRLDREYRIAASIIKYTQKLNKESIADVGQVTTISKQRIVLPCKKQDVLANVIVPKEIMDVIDDKLNFLYCGVDEEEQKL